MKKTARMLTAALLTITMATGGFPAAALAEKSDATTEASAQQKTATNNEETAGEPSDDNDIKNVAGAERPTDVDDAEKEPEPETASSESAAAEPAAQSSEHAITPTATTSTYTHTETAEQNGVTLTLGWSDAPAGDTTTFHLSATGGSGEYKFRMDAPFYMNPGEGYFGEMVADTSRGQWMTWTSSNTGCDYEFTMTASGRYYYRFYLQDAQSSVWSLRVAAEVEVSDDAHPSVDQIIANAVAQCRQETSGSEYDMALWLHDWTLGQLEYDHSLNWCSAESGLTRGQGTCESYQRIYAKLLNAAGIANGRVEGNCHTWNAVRINGKWCQMDLTWDDTSDNWYGDLDQRHLYFGLTDELMVIAHSDHAKNNRAGGYAYRSTDLSNDYFVRNGKADEWASTYVDRIQQHLDAKETSFSIDADNGAFPPSIPGIQNALVAHAMNQREWSTGDDSVKLKAFSNVTRVSSYQWSARFDFEVTYPETPVTPDAPARTIADGEYTIGCANSASAVLDISGASRRAGANVQLYGSNGTAAQRFRVSYDAQTGTYEIVSACSGLALDVHYADFSNGANVQQYTRNGSKAQRWLITPKGDGTYTIASAGNASLVLDAKWGGTSDGTNVQIYESNGSAAQRWKFTAAAQ